MPELLIALNPTPMFTMRPVPLYGILPSLRVVLHFEPPAKSRLNHCSMHHYICVSLVAYKVEIILCEVMSTKADLVHVIL